jgi:beta-xylosidase
MVRVLLLHAFLCGFVTPVIAQKDIKKGFYVNPVLGGDYPDPSVIRVGKDFYMTHSSFEYCPGLLIWHSTDLIHWERVTYALHKYIGSVWAPDLIKYKDSFYIYFPAGRKIWVVTAKSPEGPWSDPIDTNLQGFIDPGHVVDKEGKRYLYLSNGNLAQLTPDGLSAVGIPESGYKGWQFPESWSTECFCLESPKSTVKDGYFYQTVAEGGTAGPATSHMVVSGRSTSPHGPWENSPYNPIVHTKSRNEKWWSQGHGTLVDDINGNWWIMYHSYEKYFQTLGRQTLLLPVEWTKDHWFRVPDHIIASDSIRKPAGSSNLPADNLSDDFSKDKIGLQWQSFKHFPESISKKNGTLEWWGKGNSFDDSPPLLVNAGDEKYEVQVEYSIDDSVTAGLTLFYNEQANMRVEANANQFAVYNQKSRKISVKNEIGKHGYLKILNDENEISFYYSADGKTWKKVERSIDASGFNHNVFGGFMSLRAGIFVFGKGKVVYDNFKYTKLTH